MILAAALSAEGGEPPEDLEAWWRWQYFGIPPRGGGQIDQTAGQLQRMIVFRRAHDLWDVYTGRPTGWTKQLSGQWAPVEFIAGLIVLSKPKDYEISDGIRELAKRYIKRVLKNGDKVEQTTTHSRGSRQKLH